jgi:hypothetical protein
MGIHCNSIAPVNPVWQTFAAAISTMREDPSVASTRTPRLPR